VVGVVAGVVVDELLGWSVWKNLVIVVVLGLRWVFFFVFLVLFVDFDGGWCRSRVDLLEMDGAEVMSGSEVVGLLRLVEVGCRGVVERLRPLVVFVTVGSLVGAGDGRGQVVVAVVMGHSSSGGSDVGTVVGT
jgi:hypothetical protein